MGVRLGIELCPELKLIIQESTITASYLIIFDIMYSFFEGGPGRFWFYVTERERMISELVFLMSLLYFQAINGFAALQDPEMRAKVLGRLQHITRLQTLLETCLEGKR